MNPNSQYRHASQTSDNLNHKRRVILMGYPPIKLAVTGILGVSARNGLISLSKKSIVRSVTKRCQSRLSPITFVSPSGDGA